MRRIVPAVAVQAIPASLGRQNAESRSGSEAVVVNRTLDSRLQTSPGYLPGFIFQPFPVIPLKGVIKPGPSGVGYLIGTTSAWPAISGARCSRIGHAGRAFQGSREFTRIHGNDLPASKRTPHRAPTYPNPPPYTLFCRSPLFCFSLRTLRLKRSGREAMLFAFSPLSLSLLIS
jgi:hypothetical protein